MRNVFAAGAVTAALVSGAFAKPSAELCKDTTQFINGNYYCQAVKRIEYHGVGGAGSYNRVTNMDVASSSCSSSPQSFKGSMSPLDDEVSMHFRGPLVLKQFAVYTPSSASSTKTKRSSPHARRHAHGHGHQHFHEHNKEIREAHEIADVEERAVGDVVIATINGKVVSWINNYGGSATATPTASSAAKSSASAAPVAATSSAKAAAAPAAASPAVASSAAASSSASTPASSPATYASAGDWTQVAYYNAKDKHATGLTFLNNMGDDKVSGTFDYTFGNSLSYASADGKSPCSSPEVFGSTLPSLKEVVIMSDKKCTGSSCGYYRPKTVPYHGFGGAQKAFFMEFSMPDDGTTGWNANMPAIWMLNAQIPRTLQYGKAECSCWTTGCGEFDIFEVLDSGNTRCKSTLHGAISGGDSNYFVRPTQNSIKAAVVMNNDNIVIQILDDSFVFGSSMSASTISGICENSNNVLTSDFVLS